jgi:hypothetical protein
VPTQYQINSRSKRGAARYQPLDRRISGALKSKARAKFNRMTAINDNPPVRKEAAAKLTHECWSEITREDVFDAWAIDGIPGDLKAWTSIARDETEPTEQDVNDQDGSGIDVEFGHDDIHMADVLMVEETSQRSDGE